MSTEVLKNLLAEKSPSTKTLMQMQYLYKMSTHWSKTEKQLTLSLFYKSPAGYKYMQEQLKLTTNFLFKILRGK